VKWPKCSIRRSNHSSRGDNGGDLGEMGVGRLAKLELVATGCLERLELKLQVAKESEIAKRANCKESELQGEQSCKLRRRGRR